MSSYIGPVTLPGLKILTARTEHAYPYNLKQLVDLFARFEKWSLECPWDSGIGREAEGRIAPSRNLEGAKWPIGGDDGKNGGITANSSDKGALDVSRLLGAPTTYATPLPCLGSSFICSVICSVRDTPTGVRKYE